MSNLPVPGVFIELAYNSNAFFQGCKKGDVCIRTAQSNQALLFGTTLGQPAVFGIDGSNIIMKGNIAVGGQTSNPLELLDIRNGNAYFDSNVYVMNYVCIGGTNPTEALQVRNGNTKLGSNLYVVGSATIGISDSNPTETLDVGSNLKVRSNAYIMSRASIGKSNPTEALDVNGSLKVTNNIYSLSNIGIGSSNPTERLDVSQNAIVRSNAYILRRMAIGNSNPTEAVDILGNQKVSGLVYALTGLGVATSNPTERLDVFDNTKLRGDVYALSKMVVGNSASNPTETLDIRGNTKISSNLYVINNEGIGLSNPSERLDINGNAKVQSNMYVVNRIGVATSNPSEKIDVSGNIIASGNIYAMNKLGVGTSLPGERVEVTGNIKSLSNVYILNSLSIGHSNPTEKIDVIGNTKVTGNLYVGNQIGINTSNPQVGFEVNTTDSILLPTGTTAQRPATPVLGHVRYNTDTSQFEGFGAGSAWGSLGGVKSTNQQTYISAEQYPTSNDDNIRFINSNQETVRITRQGFVGIGTSNPSYKLDVNGSINATSKLYLTSLTSSNENTIMFSNAVRNFWLNQRDAPLTDYLNIGRVGHYDVVISGTGLVGVGTNQPTYKLDVAGSLNAAGYCNLLLDTTSSISTSNAPTANALKLAADAAFFTSNALFLTSGNSNAASVTAVSISASNTAYWSSNNLVKKSGDIMTGALYTTVIGINNASATERLDVTGNTKVSSNLYVMSKMGVGTSNITTASNVILHIAGNTRIEGNLDVNGIYNTINTDVQLTDQFTVSNNGTGPALKVYQMGAQPVADFYDDTTLAMRIADGGNVGIGTSNPAYKLDVNGTVNATAYTGATITSLSNMGMFNSNTAVSASNTTISLSNYVYGSSTTSGSWTSNAAVFGSNTSVWSSNNLFNKNNNVILQQNKYLQVGSIYRIDEYNNGADRWFRLCTLTSNANTQFLHLQNVDASRVDGYCFYNYLSFGSCIAGYLPKFNYSRLGGTNTHINIYANSSNQYEAWVFCQSFTFFKGDINFQGVFLETSPTANNTWTASVPAGLTYMYSTASNAPYTQVDPSNGYIGIATSNPAYQLDVAGSIRQTGTTFLLSNNTNPGININNGSASAEVGLATTVGGYSSDAAINDVTIRNNTGKLLIQYGSSASAICVNTSNNVGIGRSNPSYKLDVNGTTKVGQKTSYYGSGKTMVLTPLSGSSSCEITMEPLAEAAGSNTTRSYIFSDATGLTMGTAPGGNVLFVGSNTNVGIGTLTPQAKLHVSGLISTFQSGEARYHLYNNGSICEWKLGQKTNSSHNFILSKIVGGVESDYLTVDTSGNVGIGMSNPTYNLQVNGSLGARANNVAIGPGSISEQGAYIAWNRDNGSGYMYYMNQKGTGSGGHLFGEVTTANVFTEYMRLTGSGTLGVGTSSPSSSYKVDVNGNLNATTIYQGGNTLASTYMSFQNAGILSNALTIQEATGSGGGASGGTLTLKHVNSGGSSSIVFTSTANAGSDYAYIKYTDNDTSTYFTDQTGTTECSRLTIGVENDAAAVNGETLVLKGQYGIAYDAARHFFTGGNVSIGSNDAAGYKLRVVGQIYATDDITAFSDITAKSNLEIITNPLDKVTQLNGYTYDMTLNAPSETKITPRYTGVIAQELERVLPEAVHKDTSGKLSVAYGNMAGLFVECIKELTQENKSLKEENRELKSQLQSLASKISNIEYALINNIDYALMR